MNANNLPRVSVLMGAYNEEARLKDTIDSILSQTYINFEFVIVDDGSKDGTAEILRRYATADRRIVIVKNPQNIGLTKSLNRGLEQVKGEFVARIDAGDISYQDRLAKQVEFLLKNENISIVGTNAYWINTKKEIIGICRFPLKPSDVKNRLYGQTSIALHPSLMIRTQLFKIIGPFNALNPTSMEYELYFRTIYNGYNIANLPEYLMDILRDDKGISVKHIKREFIEQYKLRVKYLPHFFNLNNIFNTVLSFFFIIIPSALLKKIVDIRIHLSNKR
jgi:glycosyltransferase EpsE